MAIVAAVCNWLSAPTCVTWGLPIVICGGTAVGWLVRAVRYAGKRGGRREVSGAAAEACAAPFPEPGAAHILATRLVMNRLLAPLYRRYVDQMGLRGDERALDYGSGSGAAARYLAKRLRAGGGHLTCVDVSARWQAVIAEVLRAFPDVDCRLGDVRMMRMPAASFDVVLVHWMLHDVAPWDRPTIIAELVRLLRPGGCLFTREPTGVKHGMPAEELRELFAAAGLVETLATEGKAPVLGEHYRAVWRKPAG